MKISTADEDIYCHFLSYLIPLMMSFSLMQFDGESWLVSVQMSTALFAIYYSCSIVTWQGCDVLWCMCLLLCLNALTANSSHMSEDIWLNFIMLTVAVAWSSSGGIAICYVFLVLWMMLCFHTVGSVCIPKWREDSITAKTIASIPIKYCSTIKIKYSVWAVHHGWALLYTTVLLIKPSISHKL